MNMFEKVMDMLPENFSIDEIAEKAGMTADEAKKGGEGFLAVGTLLASAYRHSANADLKGTF